MAEEKSKSYEDMTELEKECIEIRGCIRRKATPRGNGFEISNITVGELRKRLEGLDDSIELILRDMPKEVGKRKFSHKYKAFGYWDRSYLDMTWETLFGWIDD